MKFTLSKNPILTDYQISILRQFFSSDQGKNFFLTGGTGLAAFYLGHRLSKDLDFFTLKSFDQFAISKLVEQIASDHQAKIEIKVKSATYNEIYLVNPNWSQRIDIVKDQPIRFGEPQYSENILVDSLENIAVGKLLAIFGRLEPKDYVDLFFILKETPLDFWTLFETSKRKDLGMHEFYLGNIFAEVESLPELPETLKPVSRKDLNKLFIDLSKPLLEKAN